MMSAGIPKLLNIFLLSPSIIISSSFIITGGYLKSL